MKMEQNTPAYPGFPYFKAARMSGNADFEGFALEKLTHQGAAEISLLLASQDLNHWVYPADETWSVMVSEQDASKAEELVHTYFRENAPGKEELPDLSLRVEPLLILIFPVFFFFWVSLGTLRRTMDIRESGLMDAAKLAQGEWWRTITATMLHSGPQHLLSNLLSGYFVLNLLLLRRSLGAMSFLLLIAAALANLSSGLLRWESFRALGFSTYVFAALGALAVTEVIEARKRRKSIGLFRELQPLYSAFFVALMLGLGENSDITGHFFGFFWGGVLALKAPQGKRLQMSWEIGGLILTAGVIVGAWVLALN